MSLSIPSQLPEGMLAHGFFDNVEAFIRHQEKLANPPPPYIFPSENDGKKRRRRLRQAAAAQKRKEAQEEELKKVVPQPELVRPANARAPQTHSRPIRAARVAVPRVQPRPEPPSTEVRRRNFASTLHTLPQVLVGPADLAADYAQRREEALQVAASAKTGPEVKKLRELLEKLKMMLVIAGGFRQAAFLSLAPSGTGLVLQRFLTF